jgi:hypothetical protein
LLIEPSISPLHKKEHIQIYATAEFSNLSMMLTKREGRVPIFCAAGDEEWLMQAARKESNGRRR